MEVLISTPCQQPRVTCPHVDSSQPRVDFNADSGTIIVTLISIHDGHDVSSCDTP